MASPALLPDLCRPASLALLVLAGALLALLMALVSAPREAVLATFGLVLLFVEWVVLVSAGLLCALRRLARPRAGGPAEAWLAFGVMPLVTGLVSLAVVAAGPAAWTSVDPAWFVIRNLLISVIASAVLVRYLVLQQRWRAQVAAESAVRLDALQARIRPHFMFNALNTIVELIPDQPERAEAAVLDLSDLLRSGLKTETRHRLDEELELVRGYLRLEALRLGERLDVAWDLADDLPLDLSIPALLIQPLVENAVIHGIAPRADGGTLVIRARTARLSRLRFEIENPLPEGGKPRNGNQTALANIRQRLALAYDERAGLKIDRDEHQFRVVLTLPTDA